MRDRTDERAVSAVIGAVLLFAIVIVGLSIYQAQSVPSQNHELEIQHNERAIGDLVSLRDAIVGVASSGGTDAVSIELGMDYPARIVGINPPPVTGSLSTTGPYDVSVSGIDDGDLCHGSDSTYHVQYTPGYFEYDTHPTTMYENTVLYNKFGDVEIPVTDQQMVFSNGSSVINIVAIETQYSDTSTRTTSVDIIAGYTERHEVKDPVVTVPTTIENEDTWVSILDDEVDESDITFDPSSQTVTLSFEGTYSVICTNVGIGSQPPSGVPSNVPPDSDSPGGPTPPGAPTFQSISASEGSDGPWDTVDITYQTSDTVAEIDFTVTNDAGSTTETAENTDSGTVSVQVPGTGPGPDPGEDTYPVTVVANIVGGECLTTELDRNDGTVSDWDQC